MKEGDPLRRSSYTLEVPVNKSSAVEVLHSLRTIDKLQKPLVLVASPERLPPYQSDTLSVIVLDVIYNVPVCHPLGDHGEPGVTGVFQLTDTDKPQDVRVIQRLP